MVEAKPRFWADSAFVGYGPIQHNSDLWNVGPAFLCHTYILPYAADLAGLIGFAYAALLGCETERSWTDGGEVCGDARDASI